MLTATSQNLAPEAAATLRSELESEEHFKDKTREAGQLLDGERSFVITLHTGLVITQVQPLDQQISLSS